MAILRNKRKLAAVSRETPESARNSRVQTTFDPELAQDYISQVAEEIEGRVTKKLSNEFSRTESRFLGALSKLDEFLLNPQVRTCSVAVPGTSGNSNSKNRKPTGDRSLDDPYHEVTFSSHHSGNLNNPEVEDYPHNNKMSIYRRKIIDSTWTLFNVYLPIENGRSQRFWIWKFFITILLKICRRMKIN